MQKTNTEVDLGVDTNWAPQLTLLDELRAHLVKLQNVSKTKVAIAAAAVAGDSPKSLQKKLEKLRAQINMKQVQLVLLLLLLLLLLLNRVGTDTTLVAQNSKDQHLLLASCAQRHFAAADQDKLYADAVQAAKAASSSPVAKRRKTSEQGDGDDDEGVESEG